MAEHVHPMPGNRIGHVEKFDNSDAVSLAQPGDVTTVRDLDAANVVTSELVNSRTCHRVVLDIDHPVTAVPSTTPGHHHLYIDYVMPWSDYEKLLNVLAEVGLLEFGFATASVKRGFTSVRLPWIAKEPPLPISLERHDANRPTAIIESETDKKPW